MGRNITKPNWNIKTINNAINALLVISVGIFSVQWWKGRQNFYASIIYDCCHKYEIASISIYFIENILFSL